MNGLRIGMFGLAFISLSLGMRLALVSIADRPAYDRGVFFLLLVIASGVLALVAVKD